jgi:hypothetical protein
VLIDGREEIIDCEEVATDIDRLRGGGGDPGSMTCSCV